MEEAHTPAHKGTTVSYSLRFADLYWMWQTSPGGYVGTGVFVGLGLVLLSAVLAPEGKPVTQDVAFGLLSILVSPFFVPVVMLFASGGPAKLGKTVRLRFDQDGVEGWAVPHFRRTTWDCLRHPRLESRVLVLPFSWPFADSWVVVPATAFTPRQYELLMSILQAYGFFRERDHRSLMGRVLDVAVRWLPHRSGEASQTQMRAFPRIPPD